MSQSLETLLSRARYWADRLAWAGPLLVRISLASVFIVTGWAKLHDLEKVTGYFTELGLPMPGLNARVVATTEFVGGILVLLGLFTRLASLPLAFSMAVAILTGRRADIDGVATLFGFSEFTYFACFVWLVVAGAGAFSLDRLLFARWPKPVAGQLPRAAAPASS
ncbi:MAG: DoxX family protein [Myxococcaceae bacterium]